MPVDCSTLDPSTLDLPAIPVQTVSCTLASQLLSNMTGSRGPRSWQGGMKGVTYVLGKKSNSKLGQWR